MIFPKLSVMRALALGLAPAGLVLLYASTIGAAISETMRKELAVRVFCVGVGATVLGCLVLLVTPRLVPPRQGADVVRAAVGFLCLPPDFVAWLLVAGDEVGVSAAVVTARSTVAWLRVCLDLAGNKAEARERTVAQC